MGFVEKTIKKLASKYVPLADLSCKVIKVERSGDPRFPYRLTGSNCFAEVNGMRFGVDNLVSKADLDLSGL